MDADLIKRMFTGWEPAWKPWVAVLAVLFGLGNLSDAAFGYEKNSDFADKDFTTETCASARAKGGNDLAADVFCQDADMVDRFFTLIWAAVLLGFGGRLLKERKEEVEAGGGSAAAAVSSVAPAAVAAAPAEPSEGSETAADPPAPEGDKDESA